MSPGFWFAATPVVAFLKSNLKDTIDWGRKWLADDNPGKILLNSIHCSDNFDFIDVKMDGSVLDEKSLLIKMLEFSISSDLHWVHCLYF